jgi:Xaa-Pro dipeptidase
MDFAPIQHAMREQKIDAWLVYDFRGSNQVFTRLFPSPTGKRHLTRRVLLLIPASGEPTILHSPLDGPGLRDITLPKTEFLGWADMQSRLSAALQPGSRVAMEYVPGGALPVMSIVDAGTVELVRSFGVEVVSSANLVQLSIARWSPDAVAKHAIASQKVAAIKDAAFDLIRQRLAANKPINEHEVQQFIVQRFDAEGLQYPDPPIVGVNAHAGDPHFEVSAKDPAPIRKGDWILIDLWARIPGDDNIYSDITWVGFAGKDVPAKHREVFNAVKTARDAAVKLSQDAWRAKRRIQGWELDAAARAEIIKAGYEKAIKHRTGHSLSPGPLVHGMGVNLDSIETRDTREVLPGLGWTVEPGIYLPEFGVRLELNMYADPQKGPVVTSCVQDDIVLVA